MGVIDFINSKEIEIIKKCYNRNKTIKLKITVSILIKIETLKTILQNFNMSFENLNRYLSENINITQELYDESISIEKSIYDKCNIIISTKHEPDIVLNLFSTNYQIIK